MLARNVTIAAIRARTRAASPSGARLKTFPHTGMSLAPCAATSRPSTIRATLASGNTPPLRVAKRVRSAGICRNCPAIGPSPLPLTPWQLAQ
jgi:hypothetical protein